MCCGPPLSISWLEQRDGTNQDTFTYASNVPAVNLLDLRSYLISLSHGSQYSILLRFSLQKSCELVTEYHRLRMLRKKSALNIGFQTSFSISAFESDFSSSYTSSTSILFCNL